MSNSGPPSVSRQIRIVDEPLLSLAPSVVFHTLYRFVPELLPDGTVQNKIVEFNVPQLLELKRVN